MFDNEVVKDEELEILLLDVANKYGYDFTEYSKASIKRRVNRLCMLDKFKSFAELRYKVLKDPDYLDRFVEEVTVNVTEMFRDTHFYKALREDVLPQLRPLPHLKIWLAGCSTGEEAYSISILLQELKLDKKSLIYATDINPTVLEKAQKGIYPVQQMKLYSESYIQSGGQKEFSNYYFANYDHVQFREDLKTNIIFSTHNLVSDRSFNEFQLIICRNVLIYFNKDLQDKVFTLFDESLERLGYLALGAKETLRFSDLNDRYAQVNKEKIWRKNK